MGQGGVTGTRLLPHSGIGYSRKIPPKSPYHPIFKHVSASSHPWIKDLAIPRNVGELFGHFFATIQKEAIRNP